MTPPAFIRLSRTPAGRKGFWRDLDWHDLSTEKGLLGLLKELSRLNPLGGNVFITVNPRGRRYSGRGKSHQVKEVAAFVFELDFYHDGPASAEEALAFLETLPLRPSLIVHSGHGLHCYFLLDEPVGRSHGGRGEEPEGVMDRFGRAIVALAQQRGWKPDPVYDVARSMRLPGTFNVKECPIPVDLLKPTEGEMPVYYPFKTVEKEFLSTVPEDTYSATQPRPAALKKNAKQGGKCNPAGGRFADWEAVKRRCAASRYCVEEAANLPEPVWKFGVIGLCLYCKGGVELVHEVSSPYHGYSERETDEKIAAQLRSGAGPTWCATLAKLPWLTPLCDTCRWLGKLTTPLDGL